MARKLSTDRTLFAIAIALLGFGLVMVIPAIENSGMQVAARGYGEGLEEVRKQCVWASPRTMEDLASRSN